MLAVQYLEPSHDRAALSPADVRAPLRAAFERLPITWVLLGWGLPEALRDACAEETARAGAQFYLWLPLLTATSSLEPRPEWQTIGLAGRPVPGFQGRPEFTFLCPNQPAVVEAALDQVRRAVLGGAYQGVFLDRIRYPSPAVDPSRFLGCFCAECQRAAAAEGLDLPAAWRAIRTVLAAPERLLSFAQVLLDPSAEVPAEAGLMTLRRILDLRARSITRLVRAVASLARSQGLRVGLDCFSPALTSMVGQDLAALDGQADWIKIMTYGHTLAPAGLPFELLGLARWLIGRGAARPSEVLDFLGRAAHLPRPASLGMWEEQGLSSRALAQETRRARAAGVRTLLAGIELVDLPGVTRLDANQIAADLRAFREAEPDGLVLSWDLRWISPRWLGIVEAVWCAPVSE